MLQVSISLTMCKKAKYLAVLLCPDIKISIAVSCQTSKFFMHMPIYYYATFVSFTRHTMYMYAISFILEKYG